ncbi:DUF4157 domain-containing protein [Lysobacter enzymogenes]|uniref:eCIS core domain-containing protein n=1 Tax=Lysobacter enzymogenes TaxID=69 RepID=UPI001A96A87C|nr:DUF4157 domain-containing protein [Lysobacter enzymogenes]QQP98135.1 DUF4157 domain-containing protein [Lysobacter enzymogenes]
MSEPAARRASQRTAPKRGDTDVAARRCGCGTHTPGGGTCGACAKRGREDLSSIRLGALDDPHEHSADRASAAALAGSGFAGVPLHGGSRGGGERIDTPAAVRRTLASPGLPLEPQLREEFEAQYATSLAHVRVHRDDAADAASRELGALAWSHGDHVAFAAGRYAPASADGRQLLAHELAHAAQAQAGEPVLRRKPDPAKAAAPAKPAEPAKAADAPGQDWGRLQIFASGMDLGAQILAGAKPTFAGAKGRTPVYVGLHPEFLKVYDQTGKALTGKLQFKKDKTKGLRFAPGVYVHIDGKMSAVTVDNSNQHIDLEAGASVVATRDLSKEERAKAAADAAKPAAEGAPAKPLPVIDINQLLIEPEKYAAAVRSVPNFLLFYFVPTYPSGAGGKAGGAGGQIYASPIEGRGDGQKANAPPWPVKVTGPKLVPIDSTPTYSASVDWTANGNYTLASQVISQVGETIHYRWESYDVTQYAEQALVKDVEAMRKQTAGGDEPSYEERLERLKRAKVGSGEDVTGMGGANREFQREFENWWGDTRRAAKGTRNPTGDTAGQRVSNAVANRLALELAPVSLLTTAIGATMTWFAELFAGPRQQQEVSLKKKGIYLIRTITTPAINEDREGNQIVRPPSVDAKLTEVTTMETSVKESLDEPAAQLAELQSQIDLAVQAGNTAKADYLRELLAQAKVRHQGTPLAVLNKSKQDKQREIEELRKDKRDSAANARQREIDLIDDQIALYQRHDAQRGAGQAPMQRVNATLISEVTGEQYPLLLAAGPMAMDGSRYRWLLSDVTTRNGDAYIGLGDTPSAAFESALTKFGEHAAYGRGRIGARTVGLGLEAGAKDTIFVDSAPANWALAEKRLDDLVMTLAAIGLFVASAGTASAAIGAAVAAARLIQRWQAGKLYLDAQTVTDLLGVLGGIGAAGQLAAGLRVQKFEKVFAIVREGQFTEAQVSAANNALKGAQRIAKGAELANEALGYAGLLWGDLSFIDQMIDVAEQERKGDLTHAAARRQRAQAISSMVQNNGLFIAGNVIKAKQQAKAQQTQAKAKPAPGEGGAGKALEPAAKGGAGEPAPKPGEAHDAAPGKIEPRPEPLAEGAQGENKPKREGEPEARADADAKAAPKADSVPAGERRATPQELAGALPPDLRQMLNITDTLQGDSVQVEYKLDKNTGLISEITVSASPDARPETVALHVDTVRQMQKYQGFGGQVRNAIAKVGKLIGFETITPEHKAAYEAVLEIRKLPKLIDAQMQRMQSMRPDALKLAAAELDSLKLQLEQHLRNLDLGPELAGDGQGYVAGKGLSKQKQKRYAELTEKLRNYDAGTDSHKKIRREMYELIGGDMPYDSWERVYDSNVERANKANKIVAEEHARLGWGDTEQTIKTGKDEVRRLDIADVAKKTGIEIKAYESGEIYATEDNLSEIERDAKLVKRGWKIKWVLIDTEPSGPLLKKLLESGILVERRTRTKSGTQFVSRNLPRK